ncbi:hypothetical protein X975_15688, partial [Stegodyphus mimosarum]
MYAKYKVVSAILIVTLACFSSILNIPISLKIRTISANYICFLNNND